MGGRAKTVCGIETQVTDVIILDGQTIIGGCVRLGVLYTLLRQLRARSVLS